MFRGEGKEIKKKKAKEKKKQLDDMMLIWEGKSEG